MKKHIELKKSGIYFPQFGEELEEKSGIIKKNISYKNFGLFDKEDVPFMTFQMEFSKSKKNWLYHNIALKMVMNNKEQLSWYIQFRLNQNKKTYSIYTLNKNNGKMYLVNGKKLFTHSAVYNDKLVLDSICELIYGSELANFKRVKSKAL